VISTCEEKDVLESVWETSAFMKKEAFEIAGKRRSHNHGATGVTPTSALRFNPADGKPRQTASIRQIQFLADMIAMSLDGLFAQMQSAGNFFCSEPLAGQFEHFKLAVTQLAKR